MKVDVRTVSGVAMTNRKSQRGASLVEYSLCTAFVAVLAFSSISSFSGAVSDSFFDSKAELFGLTAGMELRGGPGDGWGGDENPFFSNSNPDQVLEGGGTTTTSWVTRDESEGTESEEESGDEF